MHAGPRGESRVQVRAVASADRDAVDRLVTERWGAPVVAVHDELIRPSDLPGYVAVEDGRWTGLATFRIASGACELVTIDSLDSGRGIGTALLRAVEDAARRAACARLWLITTNDNMAALRFSQRRGFRRVAVHRDAVTRARALKPEIPLVGADGIPLRDEVELELPLRT